MKRYFLWIILFFVMLIFLFYVMSQRSTSIIMANDKPNDLTPSPVFASLPNGSVLYDSCNGKAIDMIVSGSQVEILKDRSKQWYYIRYKNKLGWVKKAVLEIPEDEPTDNTSIDEETLEDYALKNLKSNTDHYVWVDIARQKVYILEKENDRWELEKTIVCSTGTNASPTLRGEFKIQDRGTWFYSDRLGSGAKYWVRYCGSYLFHSVAMDKNQNVSDGTLGKKSSNGCVRMSVADAEWFYNNIEENTSVTIY